MNMGPRSRTGIPRIPRPSEISNGRGIPAALAVACVLLVGHLTPAAAAQARPHGRDVRGSRPSAPPPNGALQTGERQIAESHYREALYNGWMLSAALAIADGRLDAARDAFTRAAALRGRRQSRRPAVAGDRRSAAERSGRGAADSLRTASAPTRRTWTCARLLAQALVSNRKVDEAVQVLEEAHAVAPDDIETTFALATGYLRVKKVDAADALFEQLTRRGRFRRPTSSSAAPTAMPRSISAPAPRSSRRWRWIPRVRHAHFYLGTIPVMDEGVVRVEEAIVEFRKELELSATDPLVNLRLGMALVEAHREKEALGPLEIAAKAPDAGWQAYQYLGRCQLALGRPADAVVSLRKALDLSSTLPVRSQIGNLHYQLAMALRQVGDTGGADAEFAAAAATAEDRGPTSGRDALDRFMQDMADAPGAEQRRCCRWIREGSARCRRDAQGRAGPSRGVDARGRVPQSWASCRHRPSGSGAPRSCSRKRRRSIPRFLRLRYLARRRLFQRAAVRQSGGRADACALDRRRPTSNARRMLALASLNVDDFAKAVELLRDDPQRDTDPSMQFAYGVALVRSGRAAEAEATFSRLVAAHADSAELNVVLGQAHAEQGDYDGGDRLAAACARAEGRRRRSERGAGHDLSSSRDELRRGDRRRCKRS